MKEQLITFDTAKLAKEKGFNKECLHFYSINSTCNYLDEPYKYSFEVNANQEKKVNNKIDNFGYGLTWSAPTQSFLQKWLRETHNIYVWLIPYSMWVCYYCKENPSTTKKEINHTEMFEIYEEVLEAGLQEALKLIK